MGLVSKGKNIVDGWVSLLLNLKGELARKRAQHCRYCEKAKHSRYLSFIDDDLKEVEGLVCGVCKCPLSALIRSTNKKCPLGKW